VFVGCRIIRLHSPRRKTVEEAIFPPISFRPEQGMTVALPVTVITSHAPSSFHGFGSNTMRSGLGARNSSDPRRLTPKKGHSILISGRHCWRPIRRTNCFFFSFGSYNGTASNATIAAMSLDRANSGPHAGILAGTVRTLYPPHRQCRQATRTDHLLPTMAPSPLTPSRQKF